MKKYTYQLSKTECEIIALALNREMKFHFGERDTWPEIQDSSILDRLQEHNVIFDKFQFPDDRT